MAPDVSGYHGVGSHAIKQEGSFDYICWMQLSNQPNWQNDAYLITTLRNAAQSLLDEIERLHEAHDRLFKDAHHNASVALQALRDRDKYRAMAVRLAKGLEESCNDIQGYYTGYRYEDHRDLLAEPDIALLLKESGNG